MSIKRLTDKAKSYDLSQENIDKREEERLSFISKFPVNKIEDLTIDEYVLGTDENSFCYWLEFKNILFGIGGGNSSKFGLYKAKDGNYYTSYGKNKKQFSGDELNQFFENLKSNIIEALKYTKNNEIEKINTIDTPIWNMVLQKILSIYYPDKFITIGAFNVIVECAHDINIEGLKLNAENLIQINYECKKALDKLPEFKDWSYIKLGQLVWEVYSVESKREYYVLGSKYGDNNEKDVFPEMYEKNIISVGFAGNINLDGYYLKNHSEITEYLKERGEESRSYNALKHFLNLKVGDRVAIKADGSPKGKKGFLSVLGIAEVIEKDGKVYKYDSEGLGHLINVKFINAPIYEEFEIGGYGRTIQRVSKREHINTIFEKEYEKVEIKPYLEDKRYWLYSPGEQARNWEEFYNDGIMGLGWDKLDDLKNYKSKEEIKEALDEAYGGDGSKKNDTTANDEFVNVMQVGDVVIAKKGVFELLGYGVVASGYIYDATRDEYKHIRKVDWKLNGSWRIEDQMVTKTLTDITQYDTKDPNYNTYYERLLGIMKGVENDTFDDGNTNTMNFPLNTIFYGPPGTGKTYNTILRAAEIIEDREIKDYKEALEIFNTNLHKQIEFITFHQNYSYEDFIQGLRPDTDNNEELTFEKRDGLFKKIADRALKNLKEWEEPTVYKKTFEEVFNQFVFPLVEGEVEEIEIGMTKVSYYITAVTDKSISFRKASGGTAHTMSISTLGRMYEAESVMGIKGLNSYYAPLLEKLLKIGKDSSGKKETVQKKNYVIIIDEINRANISRVFGELITLIEPDKRSHGEIPLETQLPSGDRFMVPSNLYIIGTMNTADKSIALLDIALRRRFVFEAMYPKYTEDGLTINDEAILKSLNESIIADKGHDFQIGHSFFMDSKNETYNLEERMNRRVIPLLLEYFMNDGKIVSQIVNKALYNTKYVLDDKAWPLIITERRE